ncbi:Hpt domain-containing protein [Aquabacterium sp.]|uniref:hybrid sensor histidine kinase/response regulator n=1 Tax=Aquabacterium sp. TaxID=1872578 RepID=UPI002CC33D48|nr:Hpt domain-containing protein [Aquabacterium sp.]HSW08179.1 Hpt domain-containing protein [Aquabacterium sp.]
MAPTLDSGMNDDLSTLAWVYDELRRSLENAHKALYRYLKEAEATGASDVEAIDPAVLRIARTQIHQSVGALELVGLGVAANPLRAAEAALTRLAARPKLITTAAVRTIEQGSFALLDFLSRRLAGKQVSPLSMFPQYKALQELAGASRVHPADLWSREWQWQSLPSEADVEPREADEATLSRVESELLWLMRGPAPAAATRMSALFAGLGAAAQTELATLWKLAAAFFEAQAKGLLPTDLYSKRVGSRLLAQLRAGQRAEASDRLAQDLLFFCAQVAVGEGRQPGPRLAAVRRAFGLEGEQPVDYEVPRLGRFDPAWIAQARKRVAAAKECWSAVAAGELARLPGLSEPFALVGDSLARLYADGDTLSRALQGASSQSVNTSSEPTPELAMEVATALLYVDASLEDGDFDHPDMPQRIQRLAQRIDDVRNGRDPGPLERWMEDLYRRVSDRQTMGSVVQELRASLSEVEKQIDQYFRNPVQRELLIPVPAQLGAMRGVLSVLGMEQASQAVLRMRDDIDELANTEVDAARAAEVGTFDRLADNLGALSFLIDMVSVQPQLAKSLFRFDPVSGNLSAVMERAERSSGFAELDTVADDSPALVEQAQSLVQAASLPGADAEHLAREFERLSQQARAADQPALAEAASRAHSTMAHDPGEQALDTAARQLDASITDFVASQVEAMPAQPTPARPVPPAGPPTAPGETGLEDDAEMREIFLEEAREVVGTARGALADLQERHDDLGAMTTLRRAFHTLKGSSRMVGLGEFGEAAWACEQLFNARLAESASADADLRGFSTEVLDHFEQWVSAIEANQAGPFRHEPVSHAADALRLEHRRLPLQAVPAIELSGVTEPVVAALVDAADEEPLHAPVEQHEGLVLPSLETLVPDLPRASDLDLTRPLPVLDSEMAALPATERVEFDALDFELTLPETVDLTPPAPATIEPLTDLVLDLDLEPVEAAPADAADTAAAPLDEATVISASSGDTLELDLPGLPELSSDELLVPAAEAAPAAEPQALLEVAEAIEISDWDGVLAGVGDELPGALPAELLADLAPVSEEIAEPAAEGVVADEDVVAAAADAVEAEAEAPTTDIVLDDMAPGAIAAVDIVADEPAAPVPQPLASEAWAEPPIVAADEAEPAMPGQPLLAVDALLSPEVDAAPEIAPPEIPAEDTDAEQVKVIGDLRINIPLFNIYLNEADELSRRLSTELAEWSHEQHRPVGDSAVALAHSLAGSSATVGYADLSQLARSLEHALMRSNDRGHGRGDEAVIFNHAAEEVRRLLHQFAAGFLRPAEPGLMQQVFDLEHAPHEASLTLSDEPDPLPQDAGDTAMSTVLGDFGQPALMPFTALPDAPARPAAVRRDALDTDEDIDAVDAIDHELFPIFEEEGEELIPQLQARLRDWVRRPGEPAAASACMRTLHTLKGGARLAGAMHLGEMAHRLETAIEHLLASDHPQADDIEPLVSRADAIEAHFEALRRGGGIVPPSSIHGGLDELVEHPVEPLSGRVIEAVMEPVPETDTAPAPLLPIEPPAVPAAAAVSSAGPVPAGLPAAAAPRPIDWARFDRTVIAADDTENRRGTGAHTAAVRVRAPLLDRLVNHAGEVTITRARIESDVAQMKGSLGDLTENLERLRRQLRDIELQAETQIGTRMEAARAALQEFDPLEMDRFTRFQELTRMMAESVNDVATVQRGLQRTLQSAEDELATQARLTRDLQDDLLRTRMVEFEGLSERLYRVVRQAAKETGKQVRLDIIGGSIEIDRGVLDRMTGSFEHLLRNSVVHGIEAPQRRQASGKEATGAITISVTQEGNEVGVDFRDDGGGLNLQRIREKARATGLLSAEAQPSDAELAGLIFHPGFSTADEVTGLAGRGVGMDVVRADVNAMGGRIETATSPGQGTSFKLVLPLTTAVTQVVMLRCAELKVAVPSTLVEIVRRAPAAELNLAYQQGSYALAGHDLPFFWLGALLQGTAFGQASGRTAPVVVIRSAAQRLVLHVDEVMGNQEVVVKNLGPQLSRLPGLTGMTLLPSGSPALIYNPVALATLYGASARAATVAAMEAARRNAEQIVEQQKANLAPLVLVVDDSLTVRRVSQRMLVREGYRVVVAKDGLEGLERLADELPAVVLTDIEMPRMDGFDLVRNMRVDARLANLPVIMITSRIAQKHRDYAAELGVNHYLGKPFAEDELLALVANYAGRVAPA